MRPHASKGPRTECGFIDWSSEPSTRTSTMIRMGFPDWDVGRGGKSGDNIQEAMHVPDPLARRKALLEAQMCAVKSMVLQRAIIGQLWLWYEERIRRRDYLR